MNQNIKNLELEVFPKWINEMLPKNTKSSFFQSSLGKIHYLSRGVGQQVIFIHGNPTWSFSWRKVIDLLNPDEFEIVAPDLLNLGLSDSLSNNQFHFENHIKAIEEFFDVNLKSGVILPK